MDKILGINFFILISFFSFGQQNNNYIEYYNLTNEGDKQIYLKNDSLAFELYKEAFKKVNYIHNSKLIIAAQLAIKQNEFKLAYEFSKLAIIQGVWEYNEFYKKREFKQFRKKNYYKIFLDSLDFFKSTFLNNMNVDYREKIKNLSIDEFSFNKKEGKSMRASNFFDFINEYGFATEKEIGGWFYSIRDLPLQYRSLAKNEKYINMIQQALKEGTFLPEVYAQIFDYSKMFKNEEPYFYYYALGNENISKEMKIEINKRRYEWGIKPIEAQKVTDRGFIVFLDDLW